MATRTRGGDGNLRRSTASPANWLWRRRRPIVAGVLRRRRWSWMTVQECTPRQRRDVLRMFERRTGHRWDSYALVNVGVLWDDHKWQLERALHARMRGGGGRKRNVVMVALRRRRTGELFLLCSTHLSVHEPNAGRWRRRQAVEIDRFLDRLQLETGCQRVIIGADLNSASEAPRGPRGVLTEGGYRSLFDVFPTDQIVNGAADTFLGFEPATPRLNARRIDDIFTTGLTIHRPAIVDTLNGSDHRFLEIGARS